jgi:hypothetical protein
MDHLPRSTTPRRFAVAIMATLAICAAALPAAAGAQVAPADDIAFEERDAISASAIQFTGVANSANARWLVDLYDQAFGRPADLGGLDHWLARIAAGGDQSRGVVARSFLNSTEGSRNEAMLAYDELLGRSADPQGLDFWTNFLRTGSVNTLRFQHLASNEYYRNAGNSNTAYVEQLYRDILGREIDLQGRAFYVGRLDNGTPAWWVSRSIYESSESLGNRVRAYYLDILGRAPTTTEVAEGVALILAEDERSVRARVLASDEAFEVFLFAALDS